MLTLSQVRVFWTRLSLVANRAEARKCSLFPFNSSPRAFDWCFLIKFCNIPGILEIKCWGTEATVPVCDLSSLPSMCEMTLMILFMASHEYVGIQLLTSQSISQSDSRFDLPEVCCSPSVFPWKIRDADVVAGQRERIVGGSRGKRQWN